MAKSLHTNQAIDFPNPVMVIVEFTGESIMNSRFISASQCYNAIIKHCRKTMEYTWGYSQLQGSVFIDPKNRSDFGVIERGYICFADEQDALQLILSNRETSRIVTMWPTMKFSMYKYT